MLLIRASKPNSILIMTLKQIVTDPSWSEYFNLQTLSFLFGFALLIVLNIQNLLLEYNVDLFVLHFDQKVFHRLLHF